MYAVISKPIYYLLKKRVNFNWGPSQAIAMHKLKYKLVFPPAFILVNYLKDAGSIIFDIDTSLKKWKAILIQTVNKKHHIMGYKSRIWFLQKKVYDAIKQKRRNMLKVLKKIRHWLYGIHFILEKNTNVLVSKLNGADTNISGVLIVK